MQEHGARAGEILSDDRVQDSTGETNRVSPFHDWVFCRNQARTSLAF
jgi:hypothetical protein